MGDYATPICMQLARWRAWRPSRSPRRWSRICPSWPFIGQVEVAPPGFINFRLEPGLAARQVSAILAERAERYGTVDWARAAQVQVEFVSANPTGPLHMGSARNAVLGDTLASVLEAAGYAVQREYYVNDAGSRMRVF